jgi:hypothetical protein
MSCKNEMYCGKDLRQMNLIWTGKLGRWHMERGRLEA